MHRMPLGFIRIQPVLQGNVQIEAITVIYQENGQLLLNLLYFDWLRGAGLSGHNFAVTNYGELVER